MDSEDLLAALRFSPAAKQAIREQIFSDRIRMIAQTAYAGTVPDFPLVKQPAEIRLITVVYLLQQKYNAYHEKGVPDAIIFDTFRDVTLRANLYYAKQCKVGITGEDVIWFRHIMNVNLFKIGTLQYQPFEMIYLDEETIGEPYMVFPEQYKRLLPSNTPVINCHIPAGADLRYDAVEASLNAAKEYLPLWFPQVHFKAFLCYSWLLYPPMLNSLPPASNIRRFGQRFTILGTCSDPEQAMEHMQPGAQTQLTRLAKENKALFGFACGVIPLETCDLIPEQS